MQSQPPQPAPAAADAASAAPERRRRGFLTSLLQPTSHAAAAELTLAQRGVAASVGALATSLLVTPLDVVKHRMQAQQLHASRFESVVRANAFARVHTGLGDVWCPRCNMAAAAAATSPHPQQHVHSHGLAPGPPHRCVEPPRAEPRFTSTRDAVWRIARAEGAGALWRGLAPALAMAVPATAVYFAAYEGLKERIKARQRQARAGAEPSEVAAALVAGTAARTAATTVTAPLELIRTRAQTQAVTSPGDQRSLWALVRAEAARHRAETSSAASTASTSSSSSSPGGLLSSLWRRLRCSVRTGGPCGLFRGLSATLWRDVPFSAVYWTGYEALRPRALAAILASPHYQRQCQQRSSSAESCAGEAHASPAAALWLSALAAGAVAGACAAVLTHPFDVLKTRRQIGLFALPGSSFGDAAPAQQSMRAALAALVRDEGARGLWIGLGPRVAKVAPSCALMISTYELAKRVAAAAADAGGAH